MDELDLDGMRQTADQLPAEHGDGLKKSVVIARALALDPRDVICDEPNPWLDPLAAAQVDDLICTLKA